MIERPTSSSGTSYRRKLLISRGTRSAWRPCPVRSTPTQPSARRPSPSGGRRGSDGDEDRLLHPQDSGLQRRDVLKDLGVPSKDPLILGVREIALRSRMFERQSVALRGSVPGQQDQRRCICRLCAEGQVQKDERERVKRAAEEDQIRTKPQGNEDGLKHQEGPAAHELRDSIRYTRSERS